MNKAKQYAFFLSVQNGNLKNWYEKNCKQTVLQVHHILKIFRFTQYFD